MWLRTATKEDIEAIQELLLETWHQTYDDIIGADVVNQITRVWHSADNFKKYLIRPSSEYIVADDGKALQGVAYAVQGALKGVPDTVLIYQLDVRPQYRNQGIGKRLLVEIEESFPAARHVRVMVIANNVDAIQFYESQGYKKVGSPRPHPEYPEIHEIALERNIG